MKHRVRVIDRFQTLFDVLSGSTLSFSPILHFHQKTNLHHSVTMASIDDEDDSAISDDYSSTAESDVERHRHLSDISSAQKVSGVIEMECLKREILEVLKPYIQSNIKPPFTAGELLVIAACCVESTDDSTDVLVWIRDTLPYYKELRTRNRFRDKAFLFPRWDDLHKVVYGLSHAIHAWATPLPIDDSTLSHRDHLRFLTVPISSKAVRVYLRRLLEPKRTGTFRFLDLPAELRNSIYRMLFVFPKSGIRAQEKEYSIETDRRATSQLQVHGRELEDKRVTS